MFIIECKDGPKAKWRPVRFGGNRFATYDEALAAACRLDQDGLPPNGISVRVRQL